MYMTMLSNSYFSIPILLLIAKPPKDQPNGIICMAICTQWRGPIPMNKKGIILRGLQTYNIFANYVLANISYVCKLCNPC
jgi:hypothetical protein